MEMMDVKAQKEHAWLKQFQGEWVLEHDGSSPEVADEQWSERGRAFGDLWVVVEGQGQMGGGNVQSLMSLGYDPAKQRFVGTYVGSKMANLWVYEGQLDEAGNALTLDSEGPDFEDPGQTAKYQDIYAFTGPNERTLSSRYLTPSGEWKPIMKMRFRRAG
jgi:hypothetical protein